MTAHRSIRRGATIEYGVANRRVSWAEAHGYHQSSLREGDRTPHEVWKLLFGLFLAVGCGLNQSPFEVALGYLNNLAYVVW